MRALCVRRAAFKHKQKAALRRCASLHAAGVARCGSAFAAAAGGRGFVVVILIGRFERVEGDFVALLSVRNIFRVGVRQRRAGGGEVFCVVAFGRGGLRRLFRQICAVVVVAQIEHAVVIGFDDVIALGFDFIDRRGGC